MDMPLPVNDPLQTAREMLRRYGLRAGALAEQRAAEAQAAGEAAQPDHWRSVAAAIAEFRRTSPTRH